ncbi:MAG TPA: ABC transporter substrate-binding protein [Pseudonocardiaceae bacterium]|jgi:ABC-type branched-subunit amino acid transport system substrate-binding protein
MLRVGACLSLTGRFSRFGVQAAHGLAAWRVLDRGAEVVVEDDGSDPARVEPCLRAVADRCDLLLGPYSTQLMRVASQVAVDLGLVVWNHGGSGDDVERAAPGHVVSVLTPTSRYAEPFLRHLAGRATAAPLWLAEGRGSFGRQVVAGAVAMADELGLQTVPIPLDDQLPVDCPPAGWDLFCAGSFEEDVARIEAARTLAATPRVIGAVAAGVRDFSQAVTSAEGVFGIAQWFPGRGTDVEVGPAERDFLLAYTELTGTMPDYPAVQAAAAAVIATYCARAAGGLSRETLWEAATGLRTNTLYGPFGIDPISGAQRDHETALVRWAANGLTSVRPATSTLPSDQRRGADRASEARRGPTDY